MVDLLPFPASYSQIYLFSYIYSLVALLLPNQSPVALLVLCFLPLQRQPRSLPALATSYQQPTTNYTTDAGELRYKHS